MTHLPNAVTIARGLAGPIGAFLLLESRYAGVELQNEALSNGYAIASGLVLLIAALSDGFDGWLARRFNAESALGALLDPIADKVLVGSYLVAFVMITNVDLWLALPVAIIIARDLTITGLRLNAAEPTVLTVTRDAKIKTALQMAVTAAPFVFVPILSVTGASQATRDHVIIFWFGAVWFLAVLTVWTALPYLKAVRAANRR
ncbi:MAG: CDP-alcohol phosphatidyltransferase family protein [Alphaproteobacteria bacterium]|nr:CDP-alcohol phosphatidyltransferase family protein [Alphaproteobacteria bacterium]